MTKYIHIINLKTDEVASDEEARQVGVGLVIDNIDYASGFVIVCVTDEPIDPREEYKLKLAYEGEIEKVHKLECKCALCDVVNAMGEGEDASYGTTDRSD